MPPRYLFKSISGFNIKPRNGYMQTFPAVLDKNYAGPLHTPPLQNKKLAMGPNAIFHISDKPKCVIFHKGLEFVSTNYHMLKTGRYTFPQSPRLFGEETKGETNLIPRNEFCSPKKLRPLKEHQDLTENYIRYTIKHTWV